MAEKADGAVHLDIPIVELRQTVVTKLEDVEIQCTVENYRRMERGATCVTRPDPSGRRYELRLRKLEQTLNLRLQSVRSGADVEFWVEYGGERESARVKASECEWRVYQADIGLDVAESRQNVCLREEGRLMITCRQRKHHRFVPCVPFEALCGRTGEDQEGIVRSMAPLPSLLTDFIIETRSDYDGKKTPFHLHRALLAARTIVAQNGPRGDRMFAKWRKDDVQLVISYLYTGRMEVPDLETLKRVLAIASVLKFRSLERKCVEMGARFRPPLPLSAGSVLA